MRHLDDHEQKVGRPPVSAAEAPPCPLHVLVVDDNSLVTQVIAEYLANDGHTAEIATDGREAMEKFHENQFDVVVTNLAMPHMNGHQLIADIKRIAPNQPIILLTGFVDPIRPGGADVVVTKPVTIATFQKALAQAKLLQFTP